jgi:cyclohexa-1,5-dienecarbonyl-CoA hydratase
MDATMEPILCARAGHAAVVTLNGPPLNILDLAALGALRQTLAELAADRELTMVILRGAGERAFCAGTAVQDHAPDRVADMLSGLRQVIEQVRALPALVIAAVAGHCLGGGMELALGCDMVLATEDARFGQPEVGLGCFPPVATALYPALLGPARTLELLAFGKGMDARKAERLGLVQRLVPAGRLVEGCESLLSELSTKSAPVLRLIKQAVAASRGLPFAAALAESERIYLEELTRLEDMREGVTAFLEKRPPVWKNR